MCFIPCLQMVEEGEEVAANTECKFGLGWVYYNNYCYLFTSYHEAFMQVQQSLRRGKKISIKCSESFNFRPRRSATRSEAT